MQDELLDDHYQTDLRFHYNLKTLSNITLLLVLAAALVFIVRIVFLYKVSALMSGLEGGSGSYVDFMWYANSVDVLEVISMALVSLGCIPFFMWLYRAYYNLDCVKLRGLQVTPGWAVGWFFIPFANLYYDVVILNDLLKGTKHISIGSSVKQSIERTPAPPLGLFWLLSWIAASIVSNFAKRQILTGELESFKSGIMLELSSDCLYVLCAGIIFYIVYWVSKKQSQIAQSGITQ